MQFLRRLFKLEDKNKVEHAVIVHFTYYKDNLDPLHALEEKLRQFIAEQKVGEYDGHEIAMDLSDGFLYLYGPNAEVLFKTVKPILEKVDFMKEAIARLRFGSAGSGAAEIEVRVNE